MIIDIFPLKRQLWNHRYYVVSFFVDLHSLGNEQSVTQNQLENK